MRRLIKKRQILVFVCLIFLGFLICPVLADDSSNETLKSLENVAGQAGLKTETRLPVLVGKIAEKALQLIGLIMVVLLISGGFMWMTSGGSEEKVKKAKDLMGAAVIGLVIIILAYAIAHFVIVKLSEVTDIKPPDQ